MIIVSVDSVRTNVIRPRFLNTVSASWALEEAFEHFPVELLLTWWGLGFSETFCGYTACSVKLCWPMVNW
jgi:hypothetical protein